jgi:hypothetical protein
MRHASFQTSMGYVHDRSALTEILDQMPALSRWARAQCRSSLAGDVRAQPARCSQATAHDPGTSGIGRATANVACGSPALLCLSELDDEALERELFDELRAFTSMLRRLLGYFPSAGRPASVVNVSSVNGLGASPRAAA